MCFDVQSCSSSLLALADWRLPVRGAGAVRYAAKFGVGALQLDFGDPTLGTALNGLDLEEVTATCASHGVTIIALAGNLLNNIGLAVNPDGFEGAKAKKAVESVLDAATRLGVAQVFFPSSRKSQIRDETSLSHTARMLRWTCQEGKARVLRVASENVLPAPKALQLIEKVDEVGFQILLDTYNPVAAGLRLVDWIMALAPHLASQVHLKDGEAGCDGLVHLGAGDGDLVGTLSVLASTGISYQYVIENDYRKNDPQRLANDLNWSHEHTLSIYREVEDQTTQLQLKCPFP